MSAGDIAMIGVVLFLLARGEMLSNKDDPEKLETSYMALVLLMLFSGLSMVIWGMSMRVAQLLMGIFS